jgi:hypothetical protein
VNLQYRNRTGKIYYLFQGETKTGKPRYFFSSQQAGKGKGRTIEKVPEGYEIYEHPENAQVFLRKKRPRLISDIEEQFVKNELNKLKRSSRYIADCKNKYITLYESNIDVDSFKETIGSLLNNIPFTPEAGMDNKMDGIVDIANQHYTAVLRFILDDKNNRTFNVERFCFRGSIDDWIYLAGPEDFRRIVKKYVEVLGTDEFFELPYFQ